MLTCLAETANADKGGNMKLYNSIGPNPRVVRMFMAERDITLPLIEVNIRGGENREPPYLVKNPAGQSPALELDDGSYLTEITVICEYLDEVYQGGSLIGVTAEERAETRMWVRRIDLNIVEPMVGGFRYAEGLKMFQNRMLCMPQAADDMKKIGQMKLRWLNDLMAGKTYVCGDRFTLADVFLFCFVDFFNGVRQPIDPELTTLQAWYARMKERPSVAA
jgi:glutathione S-transferase